MAPGQIKELILPNRQHRCESRNNSDFAVPIMESVHKILESYSCLGTKILELLPLEMKETDTFYNSKLRLKSGILRSVLGVFPKYTCRMLDLLRLINSTKI